MESKYFLEGNTRLSLRQSNYGYNLLEGNGRLWLGYRIYAYIFLEENGRLWRDKGSTAVLVPRKGN
jgi:hypothetical protein